MNITESISGEKDTLITTEIESISTTNTAAGQVNWISAP